MKNKLLAVLPVITALFAGLTLGLFLGRNTSGGTVSVSVPARMQSIPAATVSTQAAQETTSPVCFPININTADKEALTALPGIGDVLAQRIVDYRQAHGAFTAVEELINVEGIGQARAEAILELITIGG